MDDPISGGTVSVDPISGDPVTTPAGTPGSGWGNPFGRFIDPISGDPVDTTPGTPGPGWGTPGAWGTFLTDLEKGGFGDVAKNLFGGQYGDMSQLLALGGISALLNRMGQSTQAPVGYQGGIPEYKLTREQTSAAQQRPADYRPGQGGITYFQPTQYTATGKDLAPATAGQVIGGGITSGTTGTVGGGTTTPTTPTRPTATAASARPTTPTTTTSTQPSLTTAAGITSLPGATAQAAQTATQPSPTVANFFKEIEQFYPDKKISADETAMLNRRIQDLGLDRVRKEKLDELQNFAGVTGGFSMGNPQYAAIQQKINEMARGSAVDDKTWQEKIKQMGTAGYGGANVAAYRDPKSKFGFLVTTNSQGRPVSFRTIDPSGKQLQPSTFNAANLYKYAEQYGIDLSGIGTLGKQLEEKGIKYKPYELLAGTGSDAGIDFDDIARGGLGTAFDWTVDANVGAKGPSAANMLKADIDLAARLGLKKYTDVTTESGIGIDRITPLKDKSGNVLNYVVYNPISQVASWYATPQQAQEATRQIGGSVIDARTVSRAEPKVIEPKAVAPGGVKPPGGAAGGLGSIIRGGEYAIGGGIEMLARGRYLKGNGDGVSDSIPARFAGSGQPAALADGEFVVPARVVSELGNGSSDAGARKLYAMLDRVEQRARKAKRGKPSGADRELNKLA